MKFSLVEVSTHISSLEGLAQRGLTSIFRSIGFHEDLKVTAKLYHASVKAKL